ncbi:hypothetical protein Pcar_0168 [Syntrophotalea carbinolica DSM 2380]|uniref:Uncharacterized protein n=1 Tax=Syntrophotalea carbinolica (strain DSM 2380 / NBRC 103641 / GraBd1) TaxID=338963 RepID=Q3A863_SYNC1|nr:single-stranded DNA-binding protein [Syntrophotalea carbinolica]ABA87429.1 hypothetical protein Pcar_0168 [Syntrophotalea carbinolica DSM 2380]
MAKAQITARVPEVVCQKLNYLASQKGITRQEFIEQVLTEATSGTEVPSSFQAKTYVSPEVLETIKANIDTLSAGQEIGLKKLVGHELWSELEHSTRRNFGKDFKEMVLSGEISGLSLGRKKTNNEQMYNRI